MDVNLQMTIKYVGIYNQNKAKGVTMIPDCEVAKRVMMNVYNSYLFYKILTPIEELPIVLQDITPDPVYESKNKIIMSIEELLKPRYKVVADYPDSDYEVNEIVYIVNNEGHLHSVTEDGKFLEYESLYNLFKKLEWWEERDEKDMPEYLKQDDGCVYKTSDWRHEKSLLLFDILDYDPHRRGSGWSTFNQGALRNFQPATKEEYEQYIKQSNIIPQAE